MIEKFPSIVDSYAFTPIDAALWRQKDTLLYRDLALSSASSNKMSGVHYRANGAAATFEIGQSESPFLFIIVISGEVTLRYANGESESLSLYDSATRYGPGGAVFCSLSHTGEIVVLAGEPDASAEFGSPESERWAITRERDDAYIVGDGPRAFFGYRDLGTTDLTGRRIHIQLVRAEKMASGGTGWHYHSMGQIFYILRGAGDLYVENKAAFRMTAGDAMCISPGMRHTVAGFTRDYFLIEMCVPADYDTIDAEPAVEGI